MNVIGLTYCSFSGTPRRRYWKVRYCLPAHPLDPPIACDGHILEVWSPTCAAPGDIVNPRELINYLRPAPVTSERFNEEYQA